MAQQTTAYTVYGGTNPTVIQTVTPRIIPLPIRSETLPHRNSHRYLGLIQMTLGAFSFVVSIIGFFNVISGYHFFGSGIYSGVFFVIAGLLGFLAYKQNSKCLIVACMVMNIIASCVAIIGLSFASIELSVNRTDSSTFQNAKCIIVIVVCVIEFVVTIVHAAFTCASCCDCCLPRQPVAVASVTQNPVIIHPGPPGNAASYPTQVYRIEGQLPQQHYGQQVIIQQPNLPPYPLQTQGQMSSAPQGATANAPPPYNVAFSHESPEMDPPPYSHLPAKN